MISTIPASLPGHAPTSNPCRVWSQAAGKVQCLFRGDKARMHGSVQAARRAVTHLLEIVVCLVVRRFLLPSAFPAKVYGSFCGLYMILAHVPTQRPGEGPCGRVALIPLAVWRGVSMGLSGVLLGALVLHMLLHHLLCPNSLVGLAHGDTTATTFSLTSVPIHSSCIILPGPSFTSKPLVWTGLILGTGVTWWDDALDHRPLFARELSSVGSTLLHPGLGALWMLCVGLVSGVQEAGGSRREVISPLPHSWDAPGQQPIQM